MDLLETCMAKELPRGVQRLWALHTGQLSKPFPPCLPQTKIALEQAGRPCNEPEKALCLDLLCHSGRVHT